MEPSTPFSQIMQSITYLGLRSAKLDQGRLEVRSLLLHLRQVTVQSQVENYANEKFDLQVHSCNLGYANLYVGRGSTCMPRQGLQTKTHWGLSGEVLFYCSYGTQVIALMM